MYLKPLHDIGKDAGASTLMRGKAGCQGRSTSINRIIQAYARNNIEVNIAGAAHPGVRRGKRLGSHVCEDKPGTSPRTLGELTGLAA